MESLNDTDQSLNPIGRSLNQTAPADTPAKPRSTEIDADALSVARAKQAQGRGLKNSEISLLRRAEKNPFAAIQTAPMRRLSTAKKGFDPKPTSGVDATNLKPMVNDGNPSTTASTLSFSDGSITITIDGNGVTLTNSSTGDYAKMYTTGAIGIVDASSGNEFLVSPSDLAAAGDIIPREFVVCDNGTPMGQFILAGDTFAI